MRSSSGATLREGAPPAAEPTKIFGWSVACMRPVKAIVFPSGDQRGLESSSSWSEIFLVGPPVESMTKTSVFRLSSKAFPVRSETKAMKFPSGDHCGSESFQSSPKVICRAAPVETLSTQTWLR
jgi:hypothetical protein